MIANCEVVLAVVAVSLHPGRFPCASCCVLRWPRKQPSVGRYWQGCFLNSLLLGLKLLLPKVSVLHFAKYRVMPLCCKSPAGSLSLFDLCKLMTSITNISVCPWAWTCGHSHKCVVWWSRKRKNAKKEQNPSRCGQMV